MRSTLQLAFCCPVSQADSVLIHITKFCDNWQGITLLDVVGKVSARRLESLARLKRMSPAMIPHALTPS